MAGKTKNIAASVHQRLLNKAKESSRPFNEILQLFAIERFIYRLSKSPYADRFILKGALMFSAWTGSISRPTMDIDLLGNIENSTDFIVAVFKDACETEAENDGIVFHKDTVTATRITEDADYNRCTNLLRGCRSRYQNFSRTGSSLNNHPADIPVILDSARVLAHIGHSHSLFVKAILVYKLWIIGNYSKNITPCWNR